MTRRRSSLPVPLRPVAGAYKVVRGRQDRRRTVATQEHHLLKVAALVQGDKPIKITDLPKEKPSWRSRAWAANRSFRFRNRKVLAPVYVGLLLLVSKVSMHLGPLAVVGMALAFVLLLLSPFWIRKTSPTPIAAGSKLSPRLAAYIAVVSGVSWWLIPAPTKPSVWVLVLGVGLSTAFRARRFQKAPVESSVESREEVWSTYLGDKGELTGSVMVGSDVLLSPRDGRPIGWSAGIVLPRGSKGAMAVTTDELRGRIGTVFDVGRAGVLFDVPRDTERRFVLSVIDQDGGNALDEVHPFTESDFDPATGIFTHGVRADWQPAKVQSFHPEVGAFHWHVSGANGAGKSEGIENILRQTTQHGLVVPIFCDLGDLTYTDWEPHSPVWETDPVRCLMVLLGLVELIKYRQKKMKLWRRFELPDGQVVVRPSDWAGAAEDGVYDLSVCRVYPIGREQPLVQLVFDEWHLLWGNGVQIGPRSADTIGNAALAATTFIVGQGRKAMVSALLATQSTSVPEGFGGSAYIRQQCQAGNMLGYRNGNSSGGQTFGGEIEVDPSTIPKDRKGTCYLTSPVDARDAMARTIWVREPMKLNPLLDIPGLPADELAVLRKFLDGSALIAVSEQSAVAELPEPRAPKAPSAELTFDIRTWVESNGPAGRKEIVAQFKDRASSSKVDQALKILREEEVLVSENGTYRVMEAAA